MDEKTIEGLQAIATQLPDGKLLGDVATELFDEDTAAEDWEPMAYVTAECRVTNLSPADLIAVFKSRAFTVTTVTAVEHAVGRTREMPSTFAIADVPAIETPEVHAVLDSDAAETSA